jgi:hypothetical protein
MNGVWVSRLVIGVGLVGFLFQAWSSLVDHQAADAWIMVGSVVLVGLGLGLTFAWWKR